MRREDEVEKAVAGVEREAEIAKTHDIGEIGAARLQAYAVILRRWLWGTVALVLGAWGLSCTIGTTPPPTTGADLVSAPGVSAPVIERTRQGLRQEGEAPGPALLLATSPSPAPFDCGAYARSLLPWTRPQPSPVFNAVGEATLPDAPEFRERRAAGCAVLQADAASR